MLNKAQKQQIIEELSDKFKKKKIAIITDFQGISVGDSRELRKSLKQEDAEYKVAKKTLFDRALEHAGIRLKTRELDGEVGVAFGYGDEASPAKTISQFSKTHETFKILAGVLGDRILSIEEVGALAKLPTREVMLSRVIGTFQAPIRGFVTALQGNIKNLVGVLQNIKDKKAQIT